jgi:hypothetical protein
MYFTPKQLQLQEFIGFRGLEDKGSKNGKEAWLLGLIDLAGERLF